MCILLLKLIFTQYVQVLLLCIYGQIQVNFSGGGGVLFTNRPRFSRSLGMTFFGVQKLSKKLQFQNSLRGSAHAFMFLKIDLEIPFIL